MRLVLAMVLAGLVALPLSASAQDAEGSATLEPSAAEPAPSSERAPEEPATEAKSEEPALELKLDDAGVDVTSPPRPTVADYMLAGTALRKKRAKIGLGVSGLSFGVGAILLVIGSTQSFNCFLEEPTCVVPPAADALVITGVVLMAAGLVGIIVSGILLRRSKRPPRYQWWKAQVRTRHRVQWDLAQSRLVF